VTSVAASVRNMVNEGFDLLQISQPTLRAREAGRLSMLPGG